MDNAGGEYRSSVGSNKWSMLRININFIISRCTMCFSANLKKKKIYYMSYAQYLDRCVKTYVFVGLVVLKSLNSPLGSD